MFAGTTGVDVLYGALNLDTLIGGGGADVVNGSARDDLIGIGYTGFNRFDDGSGVETLRLDGSGLSLDLTAIANNRIQAIEVINLNGNGNSLNLNQLDVLHLSDSTNRLIVDGVTGNSITSTGFGWSSGGTLAICANTYEVHRC